MSVVSKHRSVPKPASGTARYSRRQRKQTPFSSVAAASGYFLNTSFPPIFRSFTKSAEFTAAQLKQYLLSYRQLCELYQLNELDTSGLCDGSMILQTYWDALQQLQVKYRSITLHIIKTETASIYLLVQQTYSTSYCWYYIPVAPVYRLFQSKATQPAGELLLSVFHYLFRVAKIPYYRESDSYLYNVHEMIEQWLTDDFGDLGAEDYKAYAEQILQAEAIGDKILTELYKKKHGWLFAKRIQQFTPQSATEEMIGRIARRFFFIMEQYPQYDVFRHIPLPSEEEEEDSDDEPDTLLFYKYISFSADNKGAFNEQVEDTLNSEFQGYVNVEEPCIKHLLDNSFINKDDNLDFENLIFPAITQLCLLIKELP